MNHIFLSLLKDARLNMKSNPVKLDFMKLYQLANEHQVSPLIYNQIYSLLQTLQQAFLLYLFQHKPHSQRHF